MKKIILVYTIAITMILSGCGLSAGENSVSGTTSDTVAYEDSQRSSAPDKTDELKDSSDKDSSGSSKENTNQDSSESSKENTKQKPTESSKENINQDSSESSKENTNQDSSESSKENTNQDSSESNKEKIKKESSDSPKESSEQQNAQQQTKEQQAQDQQTQQPFEQPKAPEKTNYGRILFIGDSRTVDMFSADRESILGEVYDGITVYAEDARSYTFLIETMSAAGTENFDTIISWMGCNDYGDFSNYQPHYEGLLREGKRLILCTVGPTLDSALANDFDKTHYLNDFQIAYNSALWIWANANGVKVIDLYSYLANTSDVYLDPADGIHYQPKPTGVIWSVIRSALN